MLLRNGAVDNPGEAAEVLRRLCDHPRHRFWPDQIPYTELAGERLQGHRQVTDAYLAGLARMHRGRLATFDRGLAALHADVTELIASRGT